MANASNEAVGKCCRIATDHKMRSPRLMQPALHRTGNAASASIPTTSLRRNGGVCYQWENAESSAVNKGCRIQLNVSLCR